MYAIRSYYGLSSIPVYAQPRVSLFITGTELAHHGDSKIKPYQVRDSNAPMLQSAILEAGAEVVECLHVRDDLDSTIAQIVITSYSIHYTKLYETTYHHYVA